MRAEKYKIIEFHNVQSNILNRRNRIDIKTVRIEDIYPIFIDTNNSSGSQIAVRKTPPVRGSNILTARLCRVPSNTALRRLNL